jgi:hypothetical protein|tara:strand:- start:15904 stop:16089 length:186 start_codon:yes stop_codon:yes gene_type:complete
MSTETAGRKKITYNHQIKEGVVLEVIGTINEVNDTTTFVRRLDGIIVDIPTANITNTETLT